MPKKIDDEHLGDGVYASWDGYQIWLAANDHRNKVVALPRETVIPLLRYMAKVGFIKPMEPKEEEE